MPRYTKESDDDVEMKSGRKSLRPLTGGVSVDSPLRRSSRIKPNVKQNESSPESSLSDTSNVSNTQAGRVRTRRKIAMDSSAATENHRTLRSRVNSISSDVSEVTEVDVGSPLKKTKGNSDMLNKRNSLRSKRNTRAGSETKSPPTSARSKRNMRASSMEPEANTESKVLELSSTPINTRRRTSVFPSEATVVEEREEITKIAVVTLDRTLPDFIERGSTTTIQEKELSDSKDKPNTRQDSINEKTIDATSIESPQDSPSVNLAPSNSEDVEEKVHTDDEKILDNNKTVDSSETLSVDTAKQIESSVENDSQILSENIDKGISENLILKLEDSNSLKEKHEDHSDKENLTMDIVNDSKSTTNEIFNTLLQNPKQLSVNDTSANKLIEENCKSPLIETNVSPKTHSKQLSEIPNNNVPVNEDINTVNNLSVECIDILVNKEDNFDNMQKLSISPATESISDSLCSETSNAYTLINVNTNSSFDGSIKILKCTEDAVEDDGFTEINVELDKKSKEIHNEDINFKNKTEESEETINKDIIVKDACDIKDGRDMSNSLKNTSENNEINYARTSSPNLNNAKLLKSINDKCTSHAQHSIISEYDDAYCSQNTKEMNNLPSNTSSALEFSNTPKSPKNSTLTSMDEDNITNMIKNSQSSIVTETPAESVEEASEREKQSEKVSILDHSVILEEQQSKSNEKNVDADQVISKKCQENMEVDDNESDMNVVNLFQDIPATDWKGKNNDADKNSVHSASTERLENESEGECDLVLVDKEAWLAAESLKTEKHEETFDYNSDDTVLLKVRKDAMKVENDNTPTNMSKDECNLNISKDKSNTNQQKMEQKETKNKEEAIKNIKEDVAENAKKEVTSVDVKKSINIAEKNKSVTEDSNNSTCNVSLHKSPGNKNLSKSCTVEDKTKLSEYVAKKWTSLNKSVQEISNNFEVSNKIETSKKKKSLNKSLNKENEINQVELNNENIVVTSSKENEKQQSLDNSSKKKVRSQQLNINITEESDNESKESEIRQKKGGTMKTKLNKNHSVITNIECNSSESENVSDFDNSQNKTIKLPRFLFGGTSASSSDDDNDSNKTIDSDVQKEYNLHGKEISKFSDDDVPGDECRASETESSDPDDNGSDLEDFVVNDDEIEDEDVSEEDVEGIANEELVIEENAEENRKDDEEEMQQDEEIKVKQGIIQKEEENEGHKENADDNITSKPLNISKKKKNKSRKSTDSSFSQIIESDKKKKKIKQDKSRTEKYENEQSLVDLSLPNSFKTEKSKQRKASGEFIIEDLEQSLNESELTFIKKVHKHNKSMECSTPKISLSKEEKFNIKKLNVNEENENTINENMKSNKTKGNKTFEHKSLPSEFVELLSNTNLSRPMSTKILELNKTALVPESETPTTKYLRKEKLNDSAPVLKLDTKFKNLTNTSNNKEQNVQTKKDKSGNESDIKTTQDVNDSLKRKLFKVADSILKNDQKKKRKKRKQSEMVETINPVLPKTDFQEINDLDIVKINEHIVSTTSIDNNNETGKVDKKKKKKKKELVANMQIKKIKTESESNDTKIYDVKKKKKNEKTIKDVSDFTNTNEDIKKIKKQKKILDALPNENISNEQQLPKKNKKKKKLLSKDVTSQNKETSLENLPKKKKKLLLKDNVLQHEEDTIKKDPVRKQKLLKNNPDQVEDISIEKLPKKKQKLLENTTHTVTFSKSQQSKDTVSDSDEGPETVAFSKARNEVLEDFKRTADSIRAYKEMKKKKQKQHMEKMQKEKEIKIKKLESKSQVQKSNKIETQEKRKCIKRLPEEVLQNLSDVPLKPLKRRKISDVKEHVLPFLASSSEAKNIKNMYIDDDFTLPSCSGSTTEFSVVNLQKIKKKKQASEVISFRQKMLARNPRRPVSAYLMYLEKQHASGKNKFCNKPY